MRTLMSARVTPIAAALLMTSVAMPALAQGFGDRAAAAVFMVAVAAQGLAQEPGGPFSSLSPGNQKVVRALFEAQRRDVPTIKPLTLDRIAAMKSRTGWDRAFTAMKARGLVTARSLGHVVSAYEHRHRAPSGSRPVSNTGGDQNVPWADALTRRSHEERAR